MPIDWKSVASSLFEALQPFKDAADALDDDDRNDRNGRNIWDHPVAMEITTDNLRAASEAYRKAARDIVSSS